MSLQTHKQMCNANLFTKPSELGVPPQGSAPATALAVP